jgi:hypothetical protein
MARSSLTRSRPRRAGLVAVSLAVAATSGLAGAVSPAGSAVGAVGDDCPSAFPVEEVIADQAVTGLTVHSGRTPQAFTGTVLGVLDDGIAPGLDMIMVRFSSAEIDRVGGVWAGMSGSPVYAEDGRLLGAVAYGFAGTTPVAGVTPAEALHDLRAGPVVGGLGGAGDGAVELPRALGRELVAGGTVSARQADHGLVRLPTPVGVSGLQGARQMNKAAKRIGIDGTRFFRAGSARAAAFTPEEAGIEPGGSLGASLSYGDFSAVGVGTVTMVCGEEVVGFGHPMSWAGKTTMTMHGASTVYIQEDRSWVPFKVANPTGPVGTVDEDRLAGIAGVTGALPETTTVTSSATSLDTGFSRTGATYVSMPDALPYLAALGVVVNNTRVVDKLGEGSAQTLFTVEGTRGDGTPFSVTRSNRTASGWDIGYMSPWELYSTVRLLQRNGFTDVSVDSIEMDSQLTEQNLSYRIGTVEARTGNQWRRLNPRRSLSAAPGQMLRLRVTLDPAPGSTDELGTVRRQLTVPVPTTLRRGRGAELLVSGGSSGLNKRTLAPTSFDDLLTKLEERPRTDQVVARFLGRRAGASAAAASAPADQVVGGRRGFFVLGG